MFDFLKKFMFSWFYILIVYCCILIDISMIFRGEVVYGTILIIAQIPWALMTYKYHKNKRNV